jgi:hypothetical protein
MTLDKKFKKILKSFFTIFSSVLFLFLTKIKFGPILGTEMKFSASVFLGPTLAKIFGVDYGTGIIILTHLIGIVTRVYKIKALKDYFTFFPIIFAGIYFSKIFKGEKRLILIPSICILLFVLHPIGRTVWFYSGFWLIPIFISLFKEKIDKILKFPVLKIYGYSLGTAFVDHAIGSTIYLYLLKIPSKFWIAAIPLTIIERLMIAAGIGLCFLAEKIIIKIFEKIPLFIRVKKLVLE